MSTKTYDYHLRGFSWLNESETQTRKHEMPVHVSKNHLYFRPHVARHYGGLPSYISKYPCIAWSEIYNERNISVDSKIAQPYVRRLLLHLKRSDSLPPVIIDCNGRSK